MLLQKSKYDLRTYAYYFFLVMPFLTPGIVSEYQVLNLLFNVWQVMSFALLIITCLKRRKLIFSKKIIMLLLICASFLISTILNDKASIFTWLTTTILIVHMPLVMEISGKNGLIAVSKVIYSILSAEIYCNVFSQIIFPNGMYNFRFNGTSSYFFLGLDNRFIFFYLIAIVFGCLLLYLEEITKFNFNLLLITINFSLFFAWSVGAMIGIILFDLFYLFYSKIKLRSGYKTFILISIALFIIFVIAQRIDIFAAIITKYLGKSLTLSGRTYIWSHAFSELLKKPLVGYGIESRSVRSSNNYFLGYAHPHNEILYILFQGGIFALILHFIFLISCIRGLDKHKNEKIYYWYLGAYAAILIMSLVDSWADTALFYVIFFAIGSLDKIIGIKNTRTD